MQPTGPGGPCGPGGRAQCPGLTLSAVSVPRVALVALPAGMADTCSLRPRCRERQWAEGGDECRGVKQAKAASPKPTFARPDPKKSPKVNRQLQTGVRESGTEGDVNERDGHLAGAQA